MKNKLLLFLSLIILFSLSTVGLWLYFKNQEQETVMEIVPESAPVEKPEKTFLTTHPDSIPNMSQKDYHGTDLILGKVLDDNAAYTRYSIAYKSEGFKISGIMNIPKGAGPFPVLILNHGYIAPKNYTNGQGLKREQDFFARNGYAVLHSDYRNYAQSDFDPQNEIRPRAGYVEDVINAIEAVKNSPLPSLDKENIGMLGHSLGGGIALNVMVTKPDIAKAYVLLAPINSDYRVNFEKWVVGDKEWDRTAKEFVEKYGTPEDNPDLWDSLSAKNYFSEISSPVLLHQGELDKDVPVQWSRELETLLQKENKDILYFEYPSESHTFLNAQSLVMIRTLEFFDAILKK